MNRILALAFALLLPSIASAQVHVYVPGVRVNGAPPPVRLEVRRPAPSRGRIWIGGTWAWRGGRHVWLGGHYVMRPAAGYTWAPARWGNESGAWVFYEGHGVAPAAPPPVAVVETPPPPMET